VADESSEPHFWQADGVLNMIGQALVDGDAELLRECAYQFGTVVLRQGAVPRMAFEGLLTAFRSPELWAMDGSWYLLHAVSENCRWFSEEQRDDLITVLAAVYVEVSDWMACFVISEILGDCLLNERAFGVLCGFRHLGDDIRRSFASHALGHVARQRNDEVLSSRAYAELLLMRADPAGSVREEVNRALAEVKRTVGRTKGHPLAESVDD
jgi:hypothetical protein